MMGLDERVEWSIYIRKQIEKKKIQQKQIEISFRHDIFLNRR